MASTSPSTVSVVNASAKVKQVRPPGQVLSLSRCRCPVVPLPVALALAVVKALALAVVVLFMALARAPFTQCRLFVKFIK